MFKQILCRLLWEDRVASQKGKNMLVFKTLLLVIPFLVLVAFNICEAQVPDKHKDCILCHIKEDSSELKAGLSEGCIGCHPESPGRDHPIGIVMKKIPEKLPLDIENKITCVTCHEPHGKETTDRLLRMDFNKLCMECHIM